MLELMHSYELAVFKFLLLIRNPLLDGFFKFLNFFDTVDFVMILIPAVWIGFSWKEGLKLLYILVLSELLNIFLKLYFLQLRPYQIDPSFAVIQVKGYGFPSGGAQTAILLGGILFFCWKNKWARVIGINFFFWVSLARVYLGVHFPSDVLGGWIVGSILLLVYIFIFPAVETYLRNKPLYFSTLASVVIPLIILISSSSKVLASISVLIGVGLGVGISAWQNLFLEYPKSNTEAFLRMVLWVGGTFLLYKAIALLPIHDKLIITWARHLILGLWLGVGASVVWIISQSFYKRVIKV